MQFYKKTSIGKSFNPLKIIIKLLLAVLNFPSPNKLIEKKIPQENLKIVK